MVLSHGSFIYHGTSLDKLDSIMQRGLLSREELEKAGLEVRFYDFTKPGSVYFAVDCHNAWTKYPALTLAMQLAEGDESKIIRDRNFESWSYVEYRTKQVPPERLYMVFSDGSHIPLTKLQRHGKHLILKVA